MNRFLHGLDFILFFCLTTHHVRGLLRRGDEPGCRDEEGRHACPVSVCLVSWVSGGHAVACLGVSVQCMIVRAVIGT